MAHLDLAHADMKPAPIVRYEIAQEHSRAKTMFVASVIAGATRPEQVRANVQAASWAMTAADLAEVDRLAPPA